MGGQWYEGDMKYSFVPHFGSLSGTEAVCLWEKDVGISLGKEVILSQIIQKGTPREEKKEFQRQLIKKKKKKQRQTNKQTKRSRSKNICSTGK